jgi:hypothetical protein
LDAQGPGPRQGRAAEVAREEGGTDEEGGREGHAAEGGVVVSGIRATPVDTPGVGKRVSITIPDKYVVDVEPDLRFALDVEAARELRDQLVDAVDALLGTRWFR